MKTNAHHIILLGCLFAMLASQEAAAQNSPPGRIVGHIDGISQDADHYFLLGWACQQGQTKSIAVQLFAEKTANGVSKQGPLPPNTQTYSANLEWLRPAATREVVNTASS
jgi:hypothetical protein